MKPGINELIEISRFYGSNKEYVIAGGGNTSFKDDETIWIKASGSLLQLMKRACCPEQGKASCDFNQNIF